MGLLRKYLVDNFGLTAARTVLTQFGFAHGSRMAEELKAQFDWDNDDPSRAGVSIHTLEGLFRVEPGNGPLSPEGVRLGASSEAEQHVLHFGRADAGVCWTICGLLSGYLSRTGGKEVYVLEDRCIARGDAACRLLGRTREEWGEEHTEALRFFQPNGLEVSLDVALQRVTEALRAAELSLGERRRALTRVMIDVAEPSGIVATSPLMRQAVAQARRAATVDSAVLVIGESGSGRERIARLVHDESTRAAGPFVAVDCSGVPEQLLESDLFGHARGAFAGASHDRFGAFEAARNGTLLLANIGEISPALQVRLLQALRDGDVRRSGEAHTRPVDVRVMATTHRDLAHDGTEGAFSGELYSRFEAVELHVPALRERRDDLLPLARTLLAGAALRMKRKVPILAPGAMDQLLRHEWPGNVRELGNAMERAEDLARGGRVELEDLPEEIRAAVAEPDVGGGSVRPLDEVEQEYILAVLELNGGNRTQTAKQLHIGSATLYRKLKGYGALGDKLAARKPARSATKSSST